MIKKLFVVLVLAAFVAGGAFADRSMPRNTLTVDVAPALVAPAIGVVSNLMNMEVFDIHEMDASGFGIAAQYERQLLRFLSVAGRFAYLGLDVDTVMLEGHIVNLDMTSFSAEGHLRIYPFGGAFFVNGMAGWGYLGVNLDGQEQIGGAMVPFSGASLRHYVKLGAKVGWRFTFGSPGGFVFEPSFGWNHGIGLGYTHGAQIDVSCQGITREKLDDHFRDLERLVFMGGPRISLAFGFRF